MAFLIGAHVCQRDSATADRNHLLSPASPPLVIGRQARWLTAAGDSAAQSDDVGARVHPHLVTTAT